MKLRFAYYLSCILMLASVAGYAGVSTDYDHSVNFASYKTYFWIKCQAPDDIWTNRVKNEADAALAAKGWTKVDEGGDAGVVAVVTTSQQKSLNTFYNGIGGGWGFGGWGGMGMGQVTTTVNTYEEGTLVVDLFDGKNKQLIWRSSVTDSVSSKPDKNIKTLNKDVTNMFKDFPPGSKSK